MMVILFSELGLKIVIIEQFFSLIRKRRVSWEKPHMFKYDTYAYVSPHLSEKNSKYVRNIQKPY